ncbi:MAG: GTP cyclohydrolase I FolE [Halobacteria archaeon]
MNEAEEAFEDFMEALDLDLDDEHMKETPERVARSRLNEIFSGLNEDPRKHLKTTFEDAGQYRGDAGWVVEDSLQVQSMCAHHFLPIRGEAFVGYIPRDEVVGLSKLSRVVQGYSRRPQVQERLTNQIANAIYEELDAHSVIVLIKAEHMCMSFRGVQEPNSKTTTSALRGQARNEEHIKQEFFDLIQREI